jgi:phage baseplate assembly protein W
MVSDIEDIHQSLQILLSTRIGERVMQEDFGCDLNDVLFAEMDQSLINNLNRLVSDAILYHEPRITLDNLDISESEGQAGLLLISIQYTVRGTNSRYNMVFPFYINEANAFAP